MDRFERYVGKLSDAEVLALHRIVCRRAAFIYEPLYRAKREANYHASMSFRHSPILASNFTVVT